MDKIIYIMLAGAFGTLARYLIGNIFSRSEINSINFSIFIPNMIGSLLFGFIWAISYEKGWISEQVRLPILVGFMGAFTTYSTFAFDNYQLFKNYQWSSLSINLLVTNLGGILLVYLGFRLAKLF